MNPRLRLPGGVLGRARRVELAAQPGVVRGSVPVSRFVRQRMWLLRLAAVALLAVPRLILVALVVTSLALVHWRRWFRRCGPPWSLLRSLVLQAVRLRPRSARCCLCLIPPH